MKKRWGLLGAYASSMISLAHAPYEEGVVTVVPIRVAIFEIDVPRTVAVVHTGRPVGIGLARKLHINCWAIEGTVSEETGVRKAWIIYYGTNTIGTDYQAA